MILINREVIIMIDKIAKLWKTNIETLKSKNVENLNAIFIYENKRGGKQLIVGQDGSYLQVNSSVSFEKLLTRYTDGERNGKI